MFQVVARQNGFFARSRPLLFALAIAAFFFFFIFRRTFGDVPEPADVDAVRNLALSYGLLGVLVLWFLSLAVTGRFEPWALARGHNNHLSTSLFQFLTFTYVVVFVYTSMYVARWLYNPPGAAAVGDFQIPLNLLLLMGLSVATAVTSKGITVNYLQQSAISEDDQSGLSQNRSGRTDLIKVQMLVWTLISAISYLAYAVSALPDAEGMSRLSSLPEIDSALLVLMGVAQGGYLAGKLVNRDVPTPTISNVDKIATGGATSYVLSGHGFGDVKTYLLLEDAGGTYTLVGTTDVTSWTDTAIAFNLPGGAAVAAGTNVFVQTSSHRSDLKPLP